MKMIEEPQLATERKLPWLVDIFLYPLSAAGIIHLAVFLFSPPLLGLVHRLVLSRVPFGTLLALVLYIMLIGYILYYLTHCVFDSSKGGTRAPDISGQYAPDKEDLISEWFLIVGSVAICFWPAAVYYVLIRRIDLIFWLLSACGTFLFPMAVLAAVLFDATHALNPIFIVVSIFRTLPKYCGLVLFYCALGGLVVAIMSDVRRLSKPQDLTGTITYVLVMIDYLFSTAFMYRAMVLVYLAMVGSHLLGSFYWWNKHKLNWGL